MFKIGKIIQALHKKLYQYIMLSVILENLSGVKQFTFLRNICMSGIFVYSGDILKS